MEEHEKKLKEKTYTHVLNIHIYICEFMNIDVCSLYIHIYIYEYINIDICSYMYTCIYITYMKQDICKKKLDTNFQMHPRDRAHVYTPSHTCINTHTDTHTHTRSDAHILTHTQVKASESHLRASELHLVSAQARPQARWCLPPRALLP